MTREERLARDKAGPNPILFYRPSGVFGEFSNFSKHEVWLPHPWTTEQTRYATVEHRYQAMKAITRDRHDWVNASTTASESKDRGRQVKLREGWGSNYGDLCWYVMVEALLCKFSLHEDLKDILIATGDKAIYEDSPVDDIWGWRYAHSYNGKNLLGRALMEVRFVAQSF